jgi:anti-sigma-K factor RskA
MNDSPEDLACRYVLGRLDRQERAAFEARLLSDSGLAHLVRLTEAALDLRRSLLALHPNLNASPS